MTEKVVGKSFLLGSFTEQTAYAKKQLSNRARHNGFSPGIMNVSVLYCSILNPLLLKTGVV